MELDDDTPPEATWPNEWRRNIDGKLRGAFKTLRAHFRAQCAAARTPCAICGQPIEYIRRHPDPWAFELDHIEPVATAPHLALEPRNFQASHALCNRRKSAMAGPSDGMSADELEWGIQSEPHWQYTNAELAADPTLPGPDVRAYPPAG